MWELNVVGCFRLIIPNLLYSEALYGEADALYKENVHTCKILH